MAEDKGRANTTGMFKMRQLPKPEYRLLKGMITKYGFKDEAELVTCLLRLSYDLVQMKQGHIADGEQWLLQALHTLRTYTQEERVYELPG